MRGRQDDDWLPSSRTPVIATDDVHVWRASLQMATPELEALSATLSPDECRRAERFRFTKDRQGFVAGRGILRQIIALYLDVQPWRIRFVVNRYGKPALESGMRADWLRFNTSHASGLALYGFARDRSVGVDLEHIRDDRAIIEAAEHSFSRAEVSALRSLPPAQRTEAVFNCWTRKEAYLKALGQGLFHRLDDFSVSLIPGEPAALLKSENSDAGLRWSLAALSPAPGYAAAIAVEGDLRTIHRRQWTTACLQGAGVRRVPLDS